MLILVAAILYQTIFSIFGKMKHVAKLHEGKMVGHHKKCNLYGFYKLDFSGLKIDQKNIVMVNGAFSILAPR